MRKTIIFGALAALIGLGAVAQASDHGRVVASGARQVEQERMRHDGDRDRDHYVKREHKRDSSDLRDFDGDGRRDSHQRYGDRD
ncbi:MAG: hypothetical protein KIT76_03795 [Pseudolabrys sp.]|nr:hypothetical protein [Pseudolabrys sp.]